MCESGPERASSVYPVATGMAALCVGEYSAFRAGILKASGSTGPMKVRGAEEGRSRAPIPRRDEPARLSLGVIASPIAHFRFARRSPPHCLTRKDISESAGS